LERSERPAKRRSTKGKAGKPDAVKKTSIGRSQISELVTPSGRPRRAAAPGLVQAQDVTLSPTDQIAQIAAGSQVATYVWPQRGKAPSGYLKGMALSYARVFVRLSAGEQDAQAMAETPASDPNDALVWYYREFSSAGMSNVESDADTLRHLFVLLLGLGMRESSGRYCEGRDVSANNLTADTAEAGLFQSSFNTCVKSPLLRAIFDRYTVKPSGFVDYFRQGVTCRAADWKNFGTGDGEQFQSLTKSCPAFGVEFAALGVRKNRPGWGTLNGRSVEIRADCDDMLLAIQQLVGSSPQFAQALQA
jgi:hypothetical protein